MSDPRQRMTEDQARVARRVVEEESAQRTHLVVHLSGAHAYGFPSPDSDLDLKCGHIAPTHQLLSFEGHERVRNRLEWVEGVEVDYTSNELAKVLRGVVSGDGNMLERVTSHAPLAAHPDLATGAALALACTSKDAYRHYRGFAYSQADAVRKAEVPSAKKLLYVLRTALTGTHLLLERECQPDLTALFERYGFVEVPELIEIKKAGEKGGLPEAWHPRVEALLDRAFATLDGAREATTLPEHCPEPAKRELEAWMIELRRQNWG